MRTKVVCRAREKVWVFRVLWRPISLTIALVVLPQTVWAIEEVSLFYQRHEEIEAIVKLLEALKDRDGTRVRLLNVSESQDALAELREMEAAVGVTQYSSVEIFMDDRYLGGSEDIESALRLELGLPERVEVRSREGSSRFRNEVLTDTVSGGGRFRGQVQVADALSLGSLGDHGLPSETKNFKMETFVLRPMVISADLDTSKTLPPTVVPPIKAPEEESRIPWLPIALAGGLIGAFVFLLARRLRRNAEGTALARQRAV